MVPAPAPVQLFPVSYLYTGLLHLMQHSWMLTSLPQRLRVLCGGPSAVRAAGHGGLSADLLKDAAPVLLEEYVHLFYLCLRAIS